jgi:hypothetical protein
VLHILFVSREYPAVNRHGSGTYTLDFLRYLKEAGHDVKYLFLGQLPLDSDRLHRLDDQLAGFMQVLAPDHISIGKVALPRPHSPE